jgi:beta-1,2-mannobiose phosphorylase / 1,2-beta-oligomannan phosphorylase
MNLVGMPIRDLELPLPEHHKMQNHISVERLNGGEPIISPTQNWWETGVTFNAAATYLPAGDKAVIRTLLPMFAPDDPALARGVVAVHYRARPETDPGSAFTRSFIGLALFTPDLRPLYRYQEPVIYPSAGPQGFDALGVEDPRITRLDGRFYMVYCGVQPDIEKVYRAVLCLAVSDDLLHWQKLGPLPGDVNLSNNKDGVLFPDKIGDKYYLLHRPYWEGVPPNEYAIRLASSLSLEGPWLDHGEVLRSFPNPAMRISWVGAGSVPIQVGPGRYLEIYHTGNWVDRERREYDLDAALLDFTAWDGTDPRKLVLARLEHLMSPQTSAELHSHSRLQVANVLFACGSYELDGCIYIIYGGADTYTLAARVQRAGLLAALEQSGSANPFLNL